jgi:hypothetical protein
VRPAGPKPLRSRLCRCQRPDRQRDADGVAYCGNCGELRPDDRDELIAFLVVKVDKLGREVEHLSERERGVIA